MNLEDLLTMEVPRKQLVQVCKNYELKSSGNSSNDYAKVIVQDCRSRKEGEILLDEFRYAGRTAVRVYKPIELKLDYLKSIESLKKFLKTQYGNELFTNGIKVKIDHEPKLFKVYEGENKLFLSFIYLGAERRIFKNYEIVKESPQIVDYLVLHFDPLLLEMRVALNKDSIFKESFLKSIGVNDKIEWFNICSLSKSEAEILKDTLSGELTGAKHKMTEGIYDTVEVKAKLNVDLSEEDEYQDKYNDLPYRTLTFQFPFRYNNELEDEVTLKITNTENSSNNGLVFMSVVSETVIEHVISTVFTIKASTFQKIAATAEQATKI